MWVIQSADEVLDWHQDWSDWIIAGDAISESSWTIHPYGPTLTGSTLDVSAHFTSIVVSDLTAGTSYQLRNKITTMTGLEAAREIIIQCNDRQL